ncbi:MAG: hypothetical protein RL307_757 [Pseudomonadota bacterium]|jgi:uracil-DNA glycosylase family 4
MNGLSARHRAMLQEIGVPLWLPPALQRPASGKHASARVELAQSATTVSQPTQRIALPVREPIKPARVALPSDDFVPTPPNVDWATVEWTPLQAAVAECRACRLCLNRTQSVFGVGTDDAPLADRPLDWLVVGEGPGEQEDLKGEPFVGAAGKLLDQMLAAMQLSRQRTSPQTPSLYITNVVKCRPPGNRNPMPDEVQACGAHLQAQIRLLKPRFILAMGRFAAQTLLKDSVADIDTVALGKLRGQVHRHGDIPVVVSYHPSYLLRNPAEKAKSWADLCLALQAWADTNRTE